MSTFELTGFEVESAGYETVDESIRNNENYWYWQEIRRYSLENADGTCLLRANIRRNAYYHQSYANIEKWSDERGWLVIASHAITEYPCARASYVTKELSDDDFEAFIETARRLFAIGEDFIK